MISNNNNNNNKCDNKYYNFLAASFVVIGLFQILSAFIGDRLLPTNQSELDRIQRTLRGKRTATADPNFLN